MISLKTSSIQYEKKERNLVLLWCVVLLVGAYGMAVPRSQMLDRIPLIIWLMAIYPLAFHRDKDSIFYFRVILILIIGWGLEVMGVQGGVLFGKYGYGDLMGYRMIEIPFSMGAVWLTSTYLSVQIVHQLTHWKNIWAIAAVGACIMTGFNELAQLPSQIVGLWSFKDGEPWFHPLAFWAVSYFMISVGGEEFFSQENKPAKRFSIILLGFVIIWYLLLLIFR